MSSKVDFFRQNIHKKAFLTEAFWVILVKK